MSRILIIEDDEDLREGLAFSLEMDGCETACAGTKREGMEQLKKSRYDLVLLDCNLPDGSGYDLCTEIREYGDMPLFMLTARNTEMDEVKALELGAADFMSKPFSLAVLKARIRKILQSAQAGSFPEGSSLTGTPAESQGRTVRFRSAGSNTSCFCILWRTGTGCSPKNRSSPMCGTARESLWMRIRFP